MITEIEKYTTMSFCQYTNIFPFLQGNLSSQNLRHSKFITIIIPFIGRLRKIASTSVWYVIQQDN